MTTKEVKGALMMDKIKIKPDVKADIKPIKSTRSGLSRGKLLFIGIIAVLAIGLLLATTQLSATANVAFQRATQLSSCNTALSSCQGNLTHCTGNLTKCSSDLSTWQGNATACNSKYVSTNANLTACKNQISTTNTQLGTCNNKLSACNSDKSSCTTSLSTCNSDKNNCQGSLATCNSDKTAMQTNYNSLADSYAKNKCCPSYTLYEIAGNDVICMTNSTATTLNLTC